jgi:uridylate cyclase
LAVALNGGAIELDATFLYADMANSSKMAKYFDQRVTAKILKSFHLTSGKLIKNLGGVIQSFDGDRVMGVFTGKDKNIRAVKCALKINHVVTNIIKPKFEEEYPSVEQASFEIGHGVGIDTGQVLTVKAGPVGRNDLVWIGRAPNLAAKLSDLRESPYHTIITASVYNDLDDISKFNDSQDMWVSGNWPFLDDNIRVYYSSWYWKT